MGPCVEVSKNAKQGKLTNYSSCICRIETLTKWDPRSCQHRGLNPNLEKFTSISSVVRAAQNLHVLHC